MLTNQGIINKEQILVKAVSNSIQVSKLIFNNVIVPYKIWLYKYNSSSGSDITLIYTFELAAGDSVVDTNTYLLNTKDYLLAKTNVTNTTFIIESQDAADI